MAPRTQAPPGNAVTRGSASPEHPKTEPTSWDLPPGSARRSLALAGSQAQLLDQGSVDAGDFRARVHECACVERRRHGPVGLAPLASLAGAPAYLHVEDRSLRLQAASPDGHAASLPAGAGASKRAKRST